jgi:hypothetical protein
MSARQHLKNAGYAIVDVLGNPLCEGQIVLFPSGNHMMVGVVSSIADAWRARTGDVTVTHPYLPVHGGNGIRWRSKRKYCCGLVPITRPTLQDAFERGAFPDQGTAEDIIRESDKVKDRYLV